MERHPRATKPLEEPPFHMDELVVVAAVRRLAAYVAHLFHKTVAQLLQGGDGGREVLRIGVVVLPQGLVDGLLAHSNGWSEGKEREKPKRRKRGWRQGRGLVERGGRGIWSIQE